MSELVDVVLHPSQWGSVDELGPGQRVRLALVVLFFTIVTSLAAGALSSRWVRRAAPDGGGGGDELVKRIRRELVLLVGAVGLFLSIEVAPLSGKLDAILSGALFVVGTLFAARLVVHLVRMLMVRSATRVQGIERQRIEREYIPLVTKLTRLAVGLIVIITVAKHFGQDVSSLVAALGVGSLAIGLAAQQTLGNMIAGFVLLADRPFRPGDRIKLSSGEIGEVVEIGVRSTQILLNDRNLLIVPNTELVNSRVVNYAFPTSAARGEVRATVGYGSDLERASAILVELALADERVARTPAPVVRATALAASGVDLLLSFEVTFYTEVPAVEDRLRRELLKRFANAHIELPFPRTDVMLLKS